MLYFEVPFFMSSILANARKVTTTVKTSDTPEAMSAFFT